MLGTIQVLHNAANCSGSVTPPTPHDDNTVGTYTFVILK